MSTLLEQASLVMIPSGYAEDIVYSVIPQSGAGDLSFTRASNGTRINSAGLVEVVPWNMLSYSEQFDNAGWVKDLGASVTANTTTAPNGTTTADTLTIASGQYMYQGVTVNAGQSYTISVYLRVASGTKQFKFNTFGSSNNNTSSTYTATTEWQRFEYTFTTVGSGVTAIYPVLVDGLAGGSFFIWGAQLNIGSTAKPYFPTTDRLNVPRLTYQNGGGGCPSLLLEKQSTNETWYSEDFSQSYWTKQGLTVTANSIVSPDGTQNADLLTLNTSLAEHNVYAPASGLPITSNAPYTFSCYVKKGTGRYFCVATYFTGVGFGPYATFDLNTATLVASGASFGTYSSSKIENMGNDWYRCSVSGFGPYTSLIFAPDVRSASSLIPGVPFTGASETMYIWGAQFEVSSYPTSYIPTLTTSSATRVADACYKTGISSLIGQTEGTVFIDIQNYKPNAQYHAFIVLSIASSIISNHVYIGQNNNYLALFIRTGGSYSVIEYNLGTLNGRAKIAFAYGSSFGTVYLNGTQVYSSSAPVIPNGMDKIELNVFNTIDDTGNGEFNETILFKTRLTNSELAQLTGNQNYTINQAYASYGVASESPNCVQP